MQYQLPFFPSDIKWINATLGCRMQDDMVYYLHNGNPVFCHHKDDKNSYRFILGNLIVNQLCTVGELHDTLGIARKNIERYAKTFCEKGSGYFFPQRDSWPMLQNDQRVVG